MMITRRQFEIINTQHLRRHHHLSIIVAILIYFIKFSWVCQLQGWTRNYFPKIRFKCGSPTSCSIAIATIVLHICSCCSSSSSSLSKATTRPLLLDTSKGRQATTIVVIVIVVWIGELVIIHLWLTN